VVDLLKPAFRLQYEFTARMEDRLDAVARGELRYVDVVAETYRVLQEEIAVLTPGQRARWDPERPRAEIDDKAPACLCPTCGRPMRRIKGRKG
jgi:hypothetical protein